MDIFTAPATKQKHTIRQKRKIPLWGTKMALKNNLVEWEASSQGLERS